MNIENINKVFFIGIGGIGMSGLAKYFIEKGVTVLGYDREKSFITKGLVKLGAKVIYDPSKLNISEFIDNKKDTLIVYTSAISKKHPLISISFLIILFSLAGIPPLGGFFAKFYVFMSVIESEMYILAIIGLLTTVISAFYYLRIIKIIYFDEFIKPLDSIKNFSITGTLFLSCILLLTFFLYPSFLSNIVNSIFIH